MADAASERSERATRTQRTTPSLVRGVVSERACRGVRRGEAPPDEKRYLAWLTSRASGASEPRERSERRPPGSVGVVSERACKGVRRDEVPRMKKDIWHG